MRERSHESVTRVASLDLRADQGTWTYAANHHEVIDAHWSMALKANPQFFNGTVLLLKEMTRTGDRIAAAFLPTEFKNFLYWRDEGFPAEANLRDGFGSALIRSAEGYVVLGRQREGHINAGLAYLPGGFIDNRDVGTDGAIDIRASIARELLEETGLDPDELGAEAGYLVTEVAAHVSFAVVYRSSLPARVIEQRIAAHIAAEREPELAGTAVVKHPGDMKGLAMPHYARVLLSSPLAWAG